MSKMLLGRFSIILRFFADDYLRKYLTLSLFGLTPLSMMSFTMFFEFSLGFLSKLGIIKFKR